MRVSLIRGFAAAAYCATAQGRLCRSAQPLLVSVAATLSGLFFQFQS
jgi:hypothetical protein